MKKINLLAVLVFSLFLTSCSIVDLKIPGNAEPLSEKTLNTRVDVRAYGSSFFSKVAIVDKQLDFEMTREEEERFLFWKVSAANSIYSTTFQVSSRAALIDTWYTMIIMDNSMKSKEGKEKFKRVQPYLEKVLDESLLEIENIGKNYLTEELEEGKLYDLTKSFLEESAKGIEIDPVSFTGVPGYNLWKNKLGLEDESFATSGSMSDSISDLTSSMNTYSTQTPKVLEWQTQAIAYKYDIDGSEIRTTLKSVDDLSIEMQNFLRENPEFLQDAVRETDKTITKSLETVDLILKENLKELGKGRKDFQVYITEERERSIKQLNVVVKDQVNNIFDELIKAIKSLIFVFVLFVLFIFFAPLGVGIYIGKKLERRKNEKKEG